MVTGVAYTRRPVPLRTASVVQFCNIQFKYGWGGILSLGYAKSHISKVKSQNGGDAEGPEARHIHAHARRMHSTTQLRSALCAESVKITLTRQTSNDDSR